MKFGASEIMVFAALVTTSIVMVWAGRGFFKGVWRGLWTRGDDPDEGGPGRGRN
jgi:hypothetical protein